MRGSYPSWDKKVPWSREVELRHFLKFVHSCYDDMIILGPGRLRRLRSDSSPPPLLSRGSESRRSCSQLSALFPYSVSVRVRSTDSSETASCRNSEWTRVFCIVEFRSSVICTYRHFVVLDSVRGIRTCTYPVPVDLSRAH